MPVKDGQAICRDTGTVATGKGENNSTAMAFTACMKSPDGAAIFQRRGWLAGPGRVRQDK